VKNTAPVKPFVDDGHFYSPIPDRHEAHAYYSSAHFAAHLKRVDAMIDFPAMEALWRKIAPKMLAFPFEAASDFRYYARNNQFCFFDGSILSAMLAHINPERIIEIGSGYSSACMFDTLERMQKPKLKSFTCIDPDMSRLNRLSPPATVNKIVAKVQNLDLASFDLLEAGDILFIDSSHVLKTGSDVHFEYLQILPRLKKGVIVHIHDVYYPFEYPHGWVVGEGRAWNEAYLVDMILTHGNSFELMFYNDAVLQRRPELLEETASLMSRFKSFKARPFMRNTGSIWLRKT